MSEELAMTYTDPIPPPADAVTAAHAAWETCDHCQAPLDRGQRYCVSCGSRQPQADDPVAQYFVANARRARAATAAPQGPAAAAPRAARSNLWLAVVLALLPVVAALGVMVGRSSNDGEALARALAAQKAPIINVTGGGGGGTDSGSGSGDTAAGDTESTAVRGDDPNDADGKVIARTRYGSARSLTDSRVTSEQLEESRRALRHIVESQGREYVEQQRNLPDQIVIP